MSGATKLLVPRLAVALPGQLLAANRPSYELTRSTVPFLEGLFGAVLTTEALVRLAVAAVMRIMEVAMYVHVVVDAFLFSLQPSKPILLLLTIVLSLYLLRKGARLWSLEMKA